MSETKENIHFILKQFPEQTYRIEALVQKDINFKDLCRDYGRCKEALAYWSKSHEAESKQRVTEYQRLVSELEAEVITYLKREKENCNVNS